MLQFRNVCVLDMQGLEIARGIRARTSPQGAHTAVSGSQQRQSAFTAGGLQVAANCAAPPEHWDEACRCCKNVGESCITTT